MSLALTQAPLDFDSDGVSVMLTVIGGKGDDVLQGAGSDDLIKGLGGNDFIFASAGNDSLYGGSGDDTLFGSDGNNLINGGPGFDVADYNEAGGATVDLAKGTAISAWGTDRLIGVEGVSMGSDDDTVTGDSHDNLIDDSGGDNVISGGGGDDRIHIYLSDPGATWASGGDGNDVIQGDIGADTLMGDAGSDQITGGGGADLLTGGGGHDGFIFLAVGDSVASAKDEITDLSDSDKINLKHIDADTTQAGDQAFTLVSSLDGHAGQLSLTFNAKAGVTLMQADVDGDGHADMTVILDGDQTGFTHFTL